MSILEMASRAWLSCRVVAISKVMLTLNWATTWRLWTRTQVTNEGFDEDQRIILPSAWTPLCIYGLSSICRTTLELSLYLPS